MEPRLGEILVLEVVVSLGSGAKEAVDVKEVNIELSPVAGAWFRGGVGGDDGTSSVCGDVDFSLDPGDSMRVACTLKPADFRSLLVYSGRREVQLGGNVVVVPAAGQQREYFGFRILLRPLFVSPFIGAWLGAGLLSLIWAFPPLPTARQVSPVPASLSAGDLARGLIRALVHALSEILLGLPAAARFFLIGSVSATAFILIAQNMSSLDAPVSIDVRDFWGGVLVGLFSLPLARWLNEKLGLGGN